MECMCQHLLMAAAVCDQKHLCVWFCGVCDGVYLQCWLGGVTQWMGGVYCIGGGVHMGDWLQWSLWVDSTAEVAWDLHTWAYDR